MPSTIIIQGIWNQNTGNYLGPYIMGSRVYGSLGMGRGLRL